MKEGKKGKDKRVRKVEEWRDERRMGDRRWMRVRMKEEKDDESRK